MPMLYVTRNEGFLGRSGNTLLYKDKGGAVSKIPVMEVDGVIVIGQGGVSTPALHLLMQEDIPVHYINTSGRYIGSASSGTRKNKTVRTFQYVAAENPAHALKIAKGVVIGKLLNQWSVIKRFMYRHGDKKNEMIGAVHEIEILATKSGSEDDLERLRGIEGMGAAIYFSRFGIMLRPPWSFSDRNRRPPKDPVNAMLSFGYTFLLNQVVSAVLSVGLDPCFGFLHPEFRGRPSLALDLMEEFRPIVVDRLVLALCNQSLVSIEGFQSSEDGGVMMDRDVRTRFIRQFESRLNVEVKSISSGNVSQLRNHIFHQAREMADAISENRDYIPFTIERGGE